MKIDKVELIINIIMAIAIGYFLAIMLVLLISVDRSVCTDMGYDATSITWKLEPTCVIRHEVPYRDVLKELHET